MFFIAHYFLLKFFAKISLFPLGFYGYLHFITNCGINYGKCSVNMNDITSLQPNSVWKYFHAINQIPRPSKKEGKMIAYLMETGKSLGLETRQRQVSFRGASPPGSSPIWKNCSSAYGGCSAPPRL